MQKIHLFIKKYLSHIIVLIMAIIINISIHYYYQYQNKVEHTVQLNYYKKTYSNLEYQNKKKQLKTILSSNEYINNVSMTKKEFEDFFIYIVDNNFNEIKDFEFINFEIILKTFPYNKDILYRCFILDVQKTYKSLKLSENKYLYNFFIENYKNFININAEISDIIVDNLQDFKLSDIDKIELFKYVNTNKFETIFSSVDNQNLYLYKDNILHMINSNKNFKPEQFLYKFNDDELLKNIIKILMSSKEEYIKIIIEKNDMLRNIFIDNFDLVLMNNKFSEPFLSSLSNNELNIQDIRLLKQCNKKNSKECLVIEKNNFYNAQYYIYLEKDNLDNTKETKYRIFKTNNSIEKILCTIANKNKNGELINEQIRYNCTSIDKNKNNLERYETISYIDNNEYKDIYLFFNNGICSKHILFINNKLITYLENNQNGVLIKDYNNNDKRLVEYDKIGKFIKFTKVNGFIEENDFNYNLHILNSWDK